MTNATTKNTHFGFREVPTAEKTGLVREVFESVASRYDLMNDLMSMGVHRLWKQHFVANCGVRLGDRILDLAGGTGDISALLSRKVGLKGQVILADLNEAMLTIGRARLEDKGITRNVGYSLANAESLPFRDGSFDGVTMAFGLRNVTDKDQALHEIKRVMRPGGKVSILEFSSVEPELLKKLYDGYSFGLLPLLGKLVADDEDSYRYLAESIRQHPPQKELAAMMRNAGLQDVTFENYTGGIVAVHTGLA